MTSIIRNIKLAQHLLPRGQGSALDTAFIFHTSGTSTGLPKPIIQSHRAAFGVLPILDGRQSATFTTTPLYHGGIADCLRSWTSRALIWLFPAMYTPITSQNICQCLSAAAKAALEASAAEVRYFSSVPYVLQMLIENSSGLKILQSMEIVGVGGAALSPNVGNYLVENGVNLVSRFGSAECGFLLSSHRDYNADKDWQYLRLEPGSNCLCFEEHDDNSGLFELVVKKGWPHMAKTNRDDGSFATSDLFKPHHTLERAWRYQSRGDSQITLNTGKKFDPTPLEDLIASSSPLIREVLVFGTSRQSPGVLVFPSEGSLGMKDSTLEEEIWGVLQVINSNGEDFTRIHKDKLVIMSANQPVLGRSAKGTLFRGAVEKKYAADIDWAYSRDAPRPSKGIEQFIQEDNVKHLIKNMVKDVLGMDHCLTDEADFYTYGVDSAACTQIRSLLQKASEASTLYQNCVAYSFQNLVQSKDPLPWNVVYDSGNINR